VAATLCATVIVVAGTQTAGAQADSAKLCASAEVGSVVVRFVDAFNAGNLARLDRLFARKPDFRWYATDAPGRRFFPISRDRAGLIHYFARRHGRGERLELRSLSINGNTDARPKPYGNFDYRLVRSADDLSPTNYQGKGALHCYRSRQDAIIVWSMARAAG
jgi:hypothetical protein